MQADAQGEVKTGGSKNTVFTSPCFYFPLLMPFQSWKLQLLGELIRSYAAANWRREIFPDRYLQLRIHLDVTQHNYEHESPAEAS